MTGDELQWAVLCGLIGVLGYFCCKLNMLFGALSEHLDEHEEVFQQGEDDASR